MITPIACPTDMPKANRLEPTVHAVVFIPQTLLDGDMERMKRHSTSDDPVSGKISPSPCSSIIRNWNKVTVRPKGIGIICIIINGTFKFLC